MIAKILSSAVFGLDAYLVDVEVDMAMGLPMFTIVGLPDAAVKESKDRVRAALKNTGFNFPVKKVTVNLAPADIKKAYLLAWRLKCKGITIYRDGSKADQVLNLGNGTEPASAKAMSGGPVCPDCGGKLINKEGCATCIDCGWSQCTI